MGLKGHTSLAEGCGVCHPNTPGWPCHVLSIYPSVYDGIGRNVCHEESFLQFAILPTFAKVVCSVFPSRHVDSHTAHCVQ